MDLFRALDDKDYVGDLPMKIVGTLILHDIISFHNEAYRMFYSEMEYKEQWSQYVEDKMRYEAQKEMEGEGNYE